jgi:penicillin G amidase
VKRKIESYHLNGLERPVEILVDRWGIPHIYADTIDDLYLAQGFNAARDRLFQIDLWRRRGLGHLAEVLGPAYVEQDRAARLFLYRGDLAAEWSAYEFDAEGIAARFTAGVNAYIDWLASNPAQLPPEFTLLGYQPARWDPSDLVRIRSHGPQSNVLAEVIRARLTAADSVDADRLRQPLKPEHAPHVPEGVDFDLPADVLRVLELGTLPVPVAEGSNNWAVAAHRTTTGRPLLASDPHRVYSTPSLRYIAHLSAPGLNVIGAGEPFLPGITLGHNGTAAFGITLFPIDAQDLYVYELDPADAARYRYQDGWDQLRVVSETVVVKGESPRLVELAFTRHGPVIHLDADAGKAYAVRSTWFEPGTAPYFGGIGYLGAKSWQEFRAALRSWGSPGQNHVYADTSGTIGWTAAGLAPRRVGYDGLLPVPGDGRYDWDGFHSSDELPDVIDPPEGFWATANQFNLPSGFPRERQLSYEWAEPSRHHRIVEQLSEPRLYSLEDMKRLQTDLLSVSARKVVEQLRGLEPEDSMSSTALQMLLTWDAVERVDSGRAALYNVWVARHLGPAVVERLLPPAAAKILPALDLEVLHDILRRPGEWFQPKDVYALRDLLLSTLRDAYLETEELLGPDQSTWTWGGLHHNRQPHPLGRLDPSFNVGPLPIGGSGSTVNAAHYLPKALSPAGCWDVAIGASFRMVVDVGEWDNSVCINTPGQSGDPRSPHYRDLVELWRNNQYIPMLYTRAAIEDHVSRRIELVPIQGAG